MTFSPEEILVFLGPTLPLQDAKAILQARYFPPAKQGDILSLTVQFRPKVIALIDGFFMQTLSVWHKEILFALDKGIHVFGASSMGALRAAETADFGTIGVGKIFELYKSWVVNDDDEVALMHGPAEQGYIPLSLPLINIRFSLARAQEEGRLPSEIGSKIFASAAALYYPERTLEQIVKSSVEKGVPEELAKSCLEEHYVDQKKEDAILLLETIKTFSPKTTPRKPFYRTSLFDAFYHYDRRISFPTAELSQRQIAHYVSLHHPDFAELQFHALNRSLISLLAKILQIEVDEEQIEEEKKRFCLQNRLLFFTEEDWNAWFSKNDLTKESFHDLMEERAKARSLHQSKVVSQVPWKQIKYLLEELKLKNQYEPWAQKAAAQQQCIQETLPHFMETHGEQLAQDEIIETHLNETKWSPDLAYQKWCEEAGFQDPAELKIEMLKAKLAKRS
jgi:hypothetical protein